MMYILAEVGSKPMLWEIFAMVVLIVIGSAWIIWIEIYRFIRFLFKR